MGSRERIRVVHHVWRLSPAGGVPVVVRHLLHGLDPARFEQHVVSHRPLLAVDELDALPDAVRLHTLDVVGTPGPATRVRAAARLARLVHRIRPDLVHTHSGVALNLLPWRVSDRLRTPVVLEVHDASATGRVSARVDQLEAFAMRRLRLEPLVHSRAVAADVEARSGRHVEPVPLGIDVGSFRGGDGRAWRERHAIPADAVVVLYVARVVPSKNVPLFVDVARTVAAREPMVRFVLVGGGDVEGLDASAITITGSEPDVRAAYAGADVFLSTSDYEGFGIALVEAMATGLPVVSTDVGGTVDVVVDGVTGRLVPVGDAMSAVEAVTALVRDPELRRRWGDAGRERAAAHFDLRRFVDDVGALYERLIRP